MNGVIAFCKESQRLNYTAVKREDLISLIDVYNSNPFFNLVSTGKCDVTLEEIEADWKYNEEFAQSYSIALTDKKSGTIIGYSQFLTCNPRDLNPWLGLIIVKADQQGKGYAREFMESLINWLEVYGFPSLHLAVLEKNEKVLPFYEKLGFVPYEIKETQRFGTTICMRKVFKTA